MRGHVMSVYNVAFRGRMPIGSLVTGALVPKFTAPLMLTFNGVLLTMLGLLFLVTRHQLSTI